LAIVEAFPLEWHHPLNIAVITVAEVLSGQRDVLLVRHDDGPGGWQFYDGEDVSGRKPAVVTREDILKLDPSLAEVTDLPVGWLAWRNAKRQPWTREESSEG
jgi:hypothetical protein